MYGNSKLSDQFSCEPKTALKKYNQLFFFLSLYHGNFQSPFYLDIYILDEQELT